MIATRKRIHDKSRPVKLAYFLAKTTPGNNGCLLWSGFLQNSGYAKTRIGGKSQWLHRLVFELANGHLPVTVCHKCDVRACINPDHLFAGTQLDNMRDAVRKGRQAKGASLPHTKLADYISLLERAKAGESYETIAKTLGVCSQLVSRVARQHGIYRHSKLQLSALDLVARMIQVKS